MKKMFGNDSFGAITFIYIMESVTLQLLVYVNGINHLPNINPFDKQLLVPILCQALSRIVTKSLCSLNQNYHHAFLYFLHRFSSFSMFYILSCPLKLCLGLWLLVGGAVTKQ